MWDDSGNWNAAMEGYKLFRRAKQGKRESGVGLCARKCFDLNEGDNRFESLWVRESGRRPTESESVMDHPITMEGQIQNIP